MGYRGLCVGVALSIVAGVGGCSSLPATTRTAAIHDVTIGQNLTNENLLVKPGDEVRWVNMLKEEVRVDIPNLKVEDVSCQRGFTNWMGTMGESVELDTYETASLCFKKASVVNYNVKAETTLPGGLRILPGVVRVGSPQNP